MRISQLIPVEYMLLPCAGVSLEAGAHASRRAPRLAAGRYLHTEALLQNGRMLIAGGQCNVVPFDLTSADLYDPASGTFSATGSMASARSPCLHEEQS
jgi:hypothetical protein